MYNFVSHIFLHEETLNETSNINEKFNYIFVCCTRFACTLIKCFSQLANKTLCPLLTCLNIILLLFEKILKNNLVWL